MLYYYSITIESLHKNLSTIQMTASFCVGKYNLVNMKNESGCNYQPKAII